MPAMSLSRALRAASSATSLSISRRARISSNGPGPSPKTSAAAAPARARSPEVDYGCWWTLDAHRSHPRWRVSFIVDTGEVYAVELTSQRPDRFIVLGRVPGGRQAMETTDPPFGGRVCGWAEGELYLPDLAGRFE